MTNVMHKILTYLSIYFCVTCFRLSFSPSSEAGEQIRQETRTTAELVHIPVEDGLKESPKHVRQR
jgi:preprotein translocase subunit SecG